MGGAQSPFWGGWARRGADTVRGQGRVSRCRQLKSSMFHGVHAGALATGCKRAQWKHRHPPISHCEPLHPRVRCCRRGPPVLWLHVPVHSLMWRFSIRRSQYAPCTPMTLSRCRPPAGPPAGGHRDQPRLQPSAPLVHAPYQTRYSGWVAPSPSCSPLRQQNMRRKNWHRPLRCRFQPTAYQTGAQLGPFFSSNTSQKLERVGFGLQDPLGRALRKHPRSLHLDPPRPPHLSVGAAENHAVCPAMGGSVPSDAPRRPATPPRARTPLLGAVALPLFFCRPPLASGTPPAHPAPATVGNRDERAPLLPTRQPVHVPPPPPPTLPPSGRQQRSG